MTTSPQPSPPKKAERGKKKEAIAGLMIQSGKRTRFPLSARFRGERAGVRWVTFSRPPYARYPNRLLISATTASNMASVRRPVFVLRREQW